MNGNPLERLVESLATHAYTRQNLIEVALVAAAIGLGFLIANSLRKRLGARHTHWKFGEGGFDRVSSPLVALALVFASKAMLQPWQATPILDVVVSLLVAMAVIRFAMYVLRHILPKGALLRGSERTVAWIMWLGAALYLTGMLPQIVEALDAVEFTAGKQRISLLLVVQAVASVAVTLAVSMWIARIVEGRLLANEKVEMTTRVVVAKLVRAVAFFAAILIALPVVGIDITALSVFGGALGVGLGFGLQKIASNYVSGFIILLDRSVRIGDLLTVDGRHGVVREIASRYTVVRSADGTESIVPNELLVTQSVTNHSFSSREVVVKVPLAVSADADLDLLVEIMRGAASAHPGVMKDPAPAVLVTRIGEAGIEVELSAWVPDARPGLAGPRSELYRAILDGYRTRGLALPLPPRQIRIGTTDETPKK